MPYEGRSLASRLPFAPQLDRAYQGVRALLYRGGDVFCPVCERFSRAFLTYRGRKDARCPQCGALERHRGTWLYLHRATDLFSSAGKRVLHVAPEAAFVQRMRRRLGSGYVTADLSSPRASLAMDICQNPFKDDYFDAILCNHVLEHVIDDRLAMREFLRVLGPTGWAIFIVPLKRDQKTFEDATVIDPKERERLFGQWDHVRRYGSDFPDRLREEGFAVEEVNVGEFITKEERRRSRIGAHRLFLCRKPTTTGGADSG